MKKTLNDILSERSFDEMIHRVEESVDTTEETTVDFDAVCTMSEEHALQTEATSRIVRNMDKYEKEAAVREIPTSILQNEITRRLIRDHKALSGIKSIIDGLDCY